MTWCGRKPESVPGYVGVLLIGLRLSEMFVSR